MEAFLGTWKLETSEGFEEIMKRLGIDMITRKAGNINKPKLTFVQDGDVYTLKTSSTFKSGEISFTLGKSFDEKTIDGRDVKTTITMEGSTMKQVQVGGGKTTTVLRTVAGDLLTNIVGVDELTSTRVYRRA